MPGTHEIWYLLPFRFPSATAHSIQVLNTCRAMAEEGARVRLMVKRNPDHPIAGVAEGLAYYRIEPHEGFQIELMTANNVVRAIQSRWRVRRAPGGTIFYARHLALAATAARSRRGVVVVELHAIEEETERAVRGAHGIVAITSALRDRVRELYSPSGAFEVIPDGVDLSVFTPVSGDGPPRLVYAGQFHEWKGVDVLIRALKDLPGVSALVLGGQAGDDARRDKLRRLAREEGVADRIEWCGFVSQREIPARLRSGDIGVLPTRAQNGQEIAASPLKLFEYLACGLPVVASDLPSIRDVIRDGENGLLFREGDPRALAAAVKRFMEHPEQRRAVASRGREEAAQYSWSGRAKRILAFVGKLAGGDARP